MCRIRLTGALLCAAAVALAGCGGDDKDSDPRQEDDQDASSQADGTSDDDADDDAEDADVTAEVAWAGGVCDAVAAGAETLAEMPQLDSAEPADVQQQMVDYLRRISGALGLVEDTLTEQGTPPVEDGDAVYQTAVANTDAAVTAVEDAATTLEDVRADDPQAWQDAMATVEEQMAQAGAADGPIKDLREHPELDEAFDEAPSCQGVAG